MYNFVALVHETTPSNYKKMKSAGKIKTAQELLFDVYDPGYGSGGFPGVYFSLIYRGQELKLEDENNVLLVFPIDLIMKTQNWHYNVIDRNGAITYDTYYKHNILSAPSPSELEKFCGKQLNEHVTPPRPKRWPGNEVVFHDSIDLKYLHCVLNKKQIKHFKTNTCIRAPSNITFDSKRLPVMVSMSDDKYTGLEYDFYNRPELQKVLDEDYCKWMSAVIPVFEENNIPKTKKNYDSYIIVNGIIQQLLSDEIPRSSQNIQKFFDLHDRISKIKSKYHIGKYGGIYRKTPNGSRLYIAQHHE